MIKLNSSSFGCKPVFAGVEAEGVAIRFGVFNFLHIGDAKP